MSAFNNIPARDLFSPWVREQYHFSFSLLSPSPYWVGRRCPPLILDERLEQIVVLLSLDINIMEILNSSVLPKSVPDPVDEIVEGIHLKV